MKILVIGVPDCTTDAQCQNIVEEAIKIVGVSTLRLDLLDTNEMAPWRGETAKSPEETEYSRALTLVTSKIKIGKDGWQERLVKMVLDGAITEPILVVLKNGPQTSRDHYTSTLMRGKEMSALSDMCLNILSCVNCQ